MCWQKKDHKIKEVKIEVNNVIYFSTKNNYRNFGRLSVYPFVMDHKCIFMCLHTSFFKHRIYSIQSRQFAVIIIPSEQSEVTFSVAMC